MKTKYSKSKMVAAVSLLSFRVPEHALALMIEMPHMEQVGDMAGLCIEQADRMGLSDEQHVAMKSLHNEMRKKQARFKADLKIAEIDLLEILEVKDFDLETAKSAIKKSSDIKAAHNTKMVKALKEIRGILTDEQFAKINAKTPLKKHDKKKAKKKEYDNLLNI